MEMKYDIMNDNREECIYSAAKLVQQISNLYDHDNPNQAMYSEMYSRISWLLKAVADNSIGKVDPMIVECVDGLQRVVQEHMPTKIM